MSEPSTFEDVLPLLSEIAQIQEEMDDMRALYPQHDTPFMTALHRSLLFSDPHFVALKNRLDDCIRPLAGYAATWPIADAEALVVANAEILSFSNTLRALKARRDGSAHERIEAWARFETFLKAYGPRIRWIDEADMRQSMSRTLP